MGLAKKNKLLYNVHKDRIGILSKNVLGRNRNDVVGTTSCKDESGGLLCQSGVFLEETVFCKSIRQSTIWESKRLPC